MTDLAYIDDSNFLSHSTGHIQAMTPISNTFDQDTILDGQAFRDLPLLVVTKGAIGLKHTLGDGRQTISVLFLEGDVLDLRQYLSASGKLACVLPVTAFLYSSEHFKQKEQDNTKFHIDQTSNRARQQLYAAQHCVDLARKSAVEKLASFIFECRKRQQLGRHLTVSLRLRRADIADYMGLRAETLSRAFAKLRKHQFIEYNNADEIHILNEPALRQLANGKFA